MANIQNVDKDNVDGWLEMMMNDNIYEYEKKGIPFLAEFSRQVYQHEKSRKH